MFSVRWLLESVIETFVKTTLIGGLQAGLKVAVSVRVPDACPLLTVNGDDVLSDCLFVALGCLPPPLMHSAVALTVMLTVGSSPRPASLKVTKRLLSVRVADTETKCGWPANAGAAAPSVSARTAAVVMIARRILTPPKKDSFISKQIPGVFAPRSGGDRDRALVGACPMMRAPIRRMTPPVDG